MVNIDKVKEMSEVGQTNHVASKEELRDGSYVRTAKGVTPVVRGVITKSGSDGRYHVREYEEGDDGYWAPIGATSEVPTKDAIPWMKMSQETQKHWRPSPPWGISSFEDYDMWLEAREKSQIIQDDTQAFVTMIGSVMSGDSDDKANAIRSLSDEYVMRISEGNPGSDSKASKTDSGVTFKKSDYLYTPSNDPSDWKLRIAEGKSGNVTVAQLGRVVSALSEAGLRGNKTPIPSGDIPKAKARLRGLYRKLGKSPPDTLKSHASFILNKQKDGRVRFLGIYSNNYRDRDGDIISEKAHRAFEFLCKEGVTPYPELWAWHVSGSRIGACDWVSYADGFQMCSGLIDEGQEAKANKLAEMVDLGMSHGMPRRYIRRDSTDESVIDFAITSEVSVLPVSKAANLLTGFIIEENDMALSDGQKSFLAELGFDPAAIESTIADKAAEGEELDRKSEDEETQEGASTTDAESKDETPENKKEEGVREDVIKEVGETLAPILKAYADRIELLEKELKSQEAEKALVETPRASLADILAGHVVNQPTTVGESKSLKGPKETEEKESASSTGLGSFLDGLVAASGGI